MTVPSKPSTNFEDMKTMSIFIAVVIRNAMEDFHVKHLSDVQMRELNPIIRNAVFTAVHATRSMDWSEAARAYVDYLSQHIPPYWEQPELLIGYLQSLERRGEDVQRDT
jgi:hypothetical protein